MKRDVAQSVVELLFDYGGKLNDSMLLVRESATDEEFGDYRRAVGAVLATAFEKILDPIFAEHPDLKPDQLNLENPDAADPAETP